MEKKISTVWDMPQKRFLGFVNLSSFTKILYSKIHSTVNMDQGPRWSRLMEKFRGKKSGGTIPLSSKMSPREET
jgi:hypothetical protein